MTQINIGSTPNDGTPIPKEILDERERLKSEFYSLIGKDLQK